MRQATPELVELARTFIAAGHARDVELVASISAPPEASAPFTFSSGPDRGLSLGDLLAHLGDYPPCEPLGSAPWGYMDDDFAWLVDTPSVAIPGEGSIDLRITVILRRTEDGWKVAHAHLSEGVAHLQ